MTSEIVTGVVSLIVGGSIGVMSGYWRGFNTAWNAGREDRVNAQHGMMLARKEAGKLSKIIYRQRLKIRQLKATKGVAKPATISAPPIEVQH